METRPSTTTDDLGRLVLAEEKTSGGAPLNSYAYAYDANSNRTSQTVNGQATTYDHNAADQLTRAGSTTFSYDGNGNELSRSDGRSAVYNAKDQTTSMTPLGGSAIQMSYTGAGQFRRVSAGGTTFQENALGLGRATSGGASTTYLRDSGGTLLEQRTPGGDFYYLFDGLGSVVALTDTAGNVAVRYKYEPFGQDTCTPVTNACSLVNPWRFLGGLGVYTDAATGLYKMGTRYYDPLLGRFVQVDPVEGGSANFYDYANQDPINGADPSGECSVCVQVAVRVAWQVVKAGAKHGWRATKWTGRSGWTLTKYAGRQLKSAAVRIVRALGLAYRRVGPYLALCREGNEDAMDRLGPAAPEFAQAVAFIFGCVYAVRGARRM